MVGRNYVHILAQPLYSHLGILEWENKVLYINTNKVHIFLIRDFVHLTKLKLLIEAYNI